MKCKNVHKVLAKLVIIITFAKQHHTCLRL
nr:hypothetical protein YSBCXYJI_YSBCXYJI_CDS_0076 [Caudoviricetes sp.]